MAVGDRRLPPDPSTANGALFDAMVRHQVYVMRFSGHVRNRIQRLLDRSESDLADRIRSRLANAQTGTVNEQRMSTLMGLIDNLRTKAWNEVTDEWVKQLQDLSTHEATFMQNAIVSSSPVTVQTVMPAARQLKSIVNSKPFQGRLLKDWAENLQSAERARIDNSIRMGLVEGDTPDQIARRVVGSARQQGTNGVTEISRQQAAAITRTAVNHVASHARKEFMRENSELLDGELFVGVLDSRTTPVCRANDGTRHPVGRGPQPPLHINCRSLRVPWFDGDRLGQRPAKASTERQLLREFKQQHRLDDGIKNRDQLPRGTKGAYDDFKRKRVRELTGRVPGETSYQQWLSGQSTEFQDDVLGVTRGRLFRDGKLELSKFVDRNGGELNLAQLAQREASAFRAAGLDPSDY